MQSHRSVDGLFDLHRDYLPAAGYTAMKALRTQLRLANRSISIAREPANQSIGNWMY